MGAAFRKLRNHISRWSLFSLLCRREPVPDRPEVADEVAFRFKDCEISSEPSAEEIEAKERERAEQFKRDQLLPVMGMALPR